MNRHGHHTGIERAYFAYGSNMSLPHLQGWLLQFGVDPEGGSVHRPATLRNHRLRTNYRSCKHAAGACNIEPAKGAFVEGLVMRITPPALEAIKIKEGWPVRYVDLEVSVQVDGKKRAIRAITFVVHPDRRLNHDLPVTPVYRHLILVGAREAGLSPKYQRQLRRILKPAAEIPMVVSA